MLPELLRLLAILNTDAGQLAFATGLALGLSAGFLLAAAVVVWLARGRKPEPEPLPDDRWRYVTVYGSWTGGQYLEDGR